MDAKQKKIIAWTFFIIMLILGVIGVVLWVYGAVAKDQVAHYFGIATAWLSPSLIIGLVSKWILGKVQEKKTVKQIDDLLISTGVKKAPEEYVKPIKVHKSEVSGKPWRTIHGFEIYYDEFKNIMLIKIPTLENKYEYIKEFKYVLGELNEELRKMG